LAAWVKKPSSWPWANIGAGAAFFISALTLLVTLWTYWLSQRPYIGLVDQPLAELGNPADHFGWRFFISNSGTIPAAVTVNQRAFLIRNGARQEIAMGSRGTSQLILMPGQRIEIPGAAQEVPPTPALTDLAYGRLGLEVEHRIDYRGTPDNGWPMKSQYFYSSVWRFEPTSAPSSFVMVRGEAN